jgi:hypothetical protein
LYLFTDKLRAILISAFLTEVGMNKEKLEEILEHGDKYVFRF